MGFLSTIQKKNRPVIMGILNVTPDSFSDGGLYSDSSKALRHVERMIQDGVDIIDIGGESTRPGAATISVEQELDRVLPVVEKIKQLFSIPLSIDTSKPEVMKGVINLGVDMINDVNALQQKGALDVIADSDVDICLMHKQGNPQTMQQNPQYKNIVEEVKDFLQARVDACVNRGISRKRICIDPGFGFGKTLDHNYYLLSHLDALGSLNLPVLSGTSRKSMIGNLCHVEESKRLAGSIITAMIAVQKHAIIVRVHDVFETKQALDVLSKVQQFQDVN